MIHYKQEKSSFNILNVIPFHFQAYKETQDELTGELSDFKEKYREIAELLRDTREDLKQARRGKGANGQQGRDSPMFTNFS
jgi:hypothetical protein